MYGAFLVYMLHIDPRDVYLSETSISDAKKHAHILDVQV
jgi:hypothetical protein